MTKSEAAIHYACKDVLFVFDAVLSTGAAVATKYVSPQVVVRATRITYRSGKKGNRKFAPAGKEIEVRFHIGRPNYEEREFIAACRKAKEPFPVKKVQLKFLPQDRKR